VSSPETATIFSDADATADRVYHRIVNCHDALHAETGEPGGRGTAEARL
jgi:hypothetical protein